MWCNVDMFVFYSHTVYKVSFEDVEARKNQRLLVTRGGIYQKSGETQTPRGETRGNALFSININTHLPQLPNSRYVMFKNFNNQALFTQ